MLMLISKTLVDGCNFFVLDLLLAFPAVQETTFFLRKREGEREGGVLLISFVGQAVKMDVLCAWFDMYIRNKKKESEGVAFAFLTRLELNVCKAKYELTSIYRREFRCLGFSFFLSFPPPPPPLSSLRSLPLRSRSLTTGPPRSSPDTPI